MRGSAASGLGADVGSDPFQIGGATCHQEHVAAFLREHDGRSLADAAAGAGDDGDLVLELQIHSLISPQYAMLCFRSPL